LLLPFSYSGPGLRTYTESGISGGGMHGARISNRGMQEKVTGGIESSARHANNNSERQTRKGNPRKAGD